MSWPYVRCRCGWEGIPHKARTVAHDQAYSAAERNAAAHEQEAADGLA